MGSSGGNGNGSYVSRAELTAHIKGIDQAFQDVRADIAEVKWSQHALVEKLDAHFEKQDREAWLGPRGRELVIGSGFLAALAAIVLALIH